MSSFFPGLLLCSACVTYATGTGCSGRRGLSLARALLAAGVVALVTSAASRLNLTLAVAIELGFVLLIIRRPLVEAVLAPVVAWTSLFGEMFPLADLGQGASLAWALVVTVALLWPALVSMHRYERWVAKMLHAPLQLPSETARPPLPLAPSGRLIHLWRGCG